MRAFSRPRPLTHGGERRNPISDTFGPEGPDYQRSSIPEHCLIHYPHSDRYDVFPQVPLVQQSAPLRSAPLLSRRLRVRARTPWPDGGLDHRDHGRWMTRRRAMKPEHGHHHDADRKGSSRVPIEFAIDDGNPPTFPVRRSDAESHLLDTRSDLGRRAEHLRELLRGSQSSTGCRSRPACRTPS